MAKSNKETVVSRCCPSMMRKSSIFPSGSLTETILPKK